jgi:hypothetical protein
MLDIVSADDDKLAFSIQIKRVDDIQPTSAISRPRGSDAASEKQAEDVENQQRCDQKGGDRQQDRKQLRLRDVL